MEKNYLEVVKLVNELGDNQDKVFGEIEYVANGDKELKVGENIYSIKVLAENKSERIYKIIVNRLEEGNVLSNNNYLANLSIKNHSIAFVKDKLNYDITLTNEETLDLKYDLEDEKAFVKIEGNNNLKNYSVVKIIVKAEDGSTRIFNFNLIKCLDITYLILIIPLIGVLLILGVIMTIKKVKSNKKEVNPVNEEVVKEKKLILNDKKEEPKKFKVKYKSLDDTLIVKDK